MNNNDGAATGADEAVYHDADGSECSLDALCRREPAWAASRIRAQTQEIAALQSCCHRLAETLRTLMVASGDYVHDLQANNPHRARTGRAFEKAIHAARSALTALNKKA